jgi:hypothetical protein
MGAGVLVTDQYLATALRQTMRLLEETAHTTYLARSLRGTTGGTEPALAGAKQAPCTPA